MPIDDNVSNAVVMTNEQFAMLLQQIQATVISNTTATVQAQGNFSRCTSRFDGNKSSDVNAFIDAIETYKECTNTSNDNALKGLPILLTDIAATWWQGVKTTVNSWDAALDLLRRTYGPKKPAHRIFRELFSQEQDENTPTDTFVCQARALLSKMPEYSLAENVQLDMIYGLLSYNIRKEIPREKISSFEELINLARLVEETRLEAPGNPTAQKPTQQKQALRPRCKYCKNFGHLVDECKTLQKKREDSTIIASPKNKREHTSQDGATNIAPRQHIQPAITCFGCGTPGYFRRECPKCNTRDSKSSDSKLEFCLMDASEVYAKSKDRPILTIEILGSRGTGLIDTAARQSIAGHSLYRLLINKGQRFRQSHICVSLADGTQRNERASITEVNVNLEGRIIRTTFIALPEAENNFTLLGMDFIENAGIVINAPERTWNFVDECEPRELKFECSRGTSQQLIINSISMLREDEGNALSREQKTKMINTLSANEDIFALGGEPTPFAEHAIDTGDNQPTSVPPYKMTREKKLILEKEINAMLEADVIEECESPWAAPVVLVPKKDTGVRVCIDYRRLNAVTKRDSYPMPRIDELLHLAKRTLFMTTMDLQSGYWQVAVKPADRDKTAFITPIGTFRFKRMPFGLKNSGATFQRLIDRFRAGLKDVTVLAYLDDLVIVSTSFEEHLQDLNAVFDRLRKFKLRAKREKCVFARSQIKFLGHLITAEGIQPDPDKTSAIAAIPVPKNTKQLLSFIQTASWFRRFVPNFSDIARPLTDLTKKNAVWIWGDQQTDAFQKLKIALTNTPVLRQADETIPFVLRTDASNYALGAVLLQREGSDERPVEYASRLLTSAERNYNTTEREALAVVWATNKFRGYIEGAEVIVATDHQPLKWLMGLRSPSGRLARWALSLQEYNLKITYTPGKINVVADTLSRPRCAHEDAESCEACTFVIDVPVIGAKELREEQLSDPDVKKIIEAFENKDDLSSSNWASRGYVMSSGVLYRYDPYEDVEEPQLVAPKCAISRILHDYHDIPTAGHLGAERTYRRIANKYYWPGMRKTISEYVKHCLDCQRYKPTNLKPSGLLRTPAAARRSETLAIDLFGPLPTTDEGYQWILVIEDVATKWIELFPLRRATAEACAKTLIDEIILRYGTPRRLISDNGPQFIGAVMQQVAYCLGFDQTLTPVYHPEANPVERKNRDLKTHLAILVKDDHADWAGKLPSIRYTMNSSYSASTGQTPAYLTFARELKSPDEVQRDLRAIIVGENFTSEITPYLLKIADTMKEVREIHEKEQDRRNKYAEEGRKASPEYKEGDLVLVKTHVLSNATRGTTAKFATKRDGPYKIEKRVSPVSYRLADNISGKLLATYHVTDLSPWVNSGEGDSALPVQPIRRRGRPRIKPMSEPTEEVSVSVPRTVHRSRGGVCNATGPTTRSKSAKQARPCPDRVT